MTADERNEIIGWLVMWTGWKYEAFTSKSNKELLDMAERHNKLNKR